jgi:uncharacterized protein YrrD
MLRSIRQLYGKKLGASDGDIGHVRDFYFDDQRWAIRYVVADTGSWLSGRLVLISPHAFENLHQDGDCLLVNLTRQQIENSPAIESHKPVSRQYEEEYHRHYGYPYYAKSMPLWGLAGYPVVVPPPPARDTKQQAADSHLRSARSVNGYNVETSDERVGEVADFLIDGRTWVIPEIVVECGHWYAGKKVVVSTDKVSRISYDESTVYVDSTKRAFTEASEQPQDRPE